MADKTFGGVLTPGELSTFCAQIAMILKAGISVGEGVSVMLEDDQPSRSREILLAIYKKLEVGDPLYAALEATGVFPGYLVHMTEIGEKTGRLDDVMDSLVLYYEREEAVSQSIRSAVTYPMVMIAIMLLVVGVLVIYVLPVFNQVYTDLGSEMTGFARTVMDLGTLLSRYAVTVVALLAVIVVSFLVLRGRNKKEGRGFPLGRSLNAKIASGRFASAMSMMLQSGLDTHESLEMVDRLTENSAVKAQIARCKEQIAEGTAFSDALVGSGLFSGINARMVAVGFKTGSAELVMKKLAERYEDETDQKISSMIAVLEPTLVAVLSIIVGVILLTVMLPLMGVMSSIG
ncbi:MAG: type II secretion system F family protein [Oscillospiraceae bacterium]|jgi:type IV pilus assembly protein PilC|nr:type II secretion system F family protein [Oscillospiraceae bacterium]